MDYQVNILGIPVSRFNRQQVLDLVADYLRSSQPHQLATVNPEFILEAQCNERFFNLLHQTALNIPDGIGLKFAAWLHGRQIVRYAGSDLMQDIMVMAEIQSLKVAVVNWGQGLSSNDEIYKIAKQLYPELQLHVFTAERREEKIMPELENFAPNILFCSLGSPWQEEFVHSASKALPSLKLGMGIGGSFDFLTGKTKRAPHLMRILGLEWLWRLFQKPQAGNKQLYRRYRRIYNAFVVFSWKAFWDRLGIRRRNF